MKKYPENEKIKAGLQYGDIKLLAKISGYTRGTIGEMLGGRRKITDKAARAIIQLLQERQKLNDAVEQFKNQ